MPTCNGTADSVTCVFVEVEVTGSPDTVDEILRDLKPIISNDLRMNLEIVFQITLFTVSSLFGIVTNIINIVVYWKQGLRESITVGLFSLSVSDFFVVIFPLFTAACYLADHLFPNSPVQYVAVAGVSTTQARNMVYSLSCSLTAFLSVERCFCVIRPFKVKLIFTRTRTIVVIVGMVFFYSLAYAPLFASHQLRWQPNPRMNFTERFTLWYHPISEYVMAYNYSLMGIALPTTAQVVVTCTAIIMINGLHKASKFRQKSAARTYNKNPNNQDGNKNESSNDEKDQNQEDKMVLGKRDARLVKTMVILVAILSAANVPYIALKYSQIIVPDMNPRRRYGNMFRLMASIGFFLGSMNASLNTLVYYHTGSKYREIFHDIFNRKKK